MAKEELKQMINRVTIQGTLMDNNIEIKVDSKGRRYLSGPVEVKVDNDYIVPVGRHLEAYPRNQDLLGGERIQCDGWR